MNLYLRLLYVLLQTLWRPRITDFLMPSRIRLRVLPTDLDLNGHMNNGRYPTLMDLGRLDLIMRLGLLQHMTQQKSVPVLSAIKMRFRLPLYVFQAFDLETRVLCWDEKWVYMEQRFIIAKGEKANAVAAIGLVKGGFYNRRTKTTAPTQSLLEALGVQMESPPFPAYVVEWAKAEEALRSVTADKVFS